MNKAAEIVRTEMDRRHHQRFGSSMGLSEDEGRGKGCRQTEYITY